MSKNPRVRLHPEAPQKLEDAYKSFFGEEKLYKSKLAKKAKLTPPTVNKLFNNKSGKVEFYTLKSICENLDCIDRLKEFINEQDWYLIPSDIAPLQNPNLPQTEFPFAQPQSAQNSPSKSTGLLTQIDWHEVCHTLLGKGYTWVPNLLGSDLKKTGELAELYVPQKLIEPPKELKIAEDYSLNFGDFFGWDNQSTSLDYQELFREFILQQNNSQSNSLRLALVGNAGEGKTVQMLKMGEWLLQEKRGIPIWISLKLMGQKTLCDYLIKNWLPEAAQEWEEAPPEWAEELKQLCQQGKVWLLLDGVDEMGTYDPLGTLALQLDVPLLRNVQVVLTCRSNVWNDSPNALLAKFKSYNILPFSYGHDRGTRCGEDDPCQDEVAQFINHHFSHEPKLGQELRQKLEEPRYEHLKNMVKNPLCLALLCHTWTLWQQQGGLPDTKAKLYQGFIEKLYNLHNSKSLKTKTQRDQLNRALGELASWALQQPNSRFLLRLDQIPKTLAKRLGDVNEEGSLLNLAVGLSWLTDAGLAAENPNEKVYAFFHSTVQEYFASLAIDDYDFFLPRDDEGCNPNPASGGYCIFEPQWEEVFLFWLGRFDVSLFQKKTLLRELLNFNANFEDRVNWHKPRAIYLAGIGTSEFPELRECRVFYEHSDGNQTDLNFTYGSTEYILIDIANQGFVSLDQTCTKYDFSYEAISRAAKKALLKADSLVAASVLVEYYWFFTKLVDFDWLLLWQIASLLRQIAPEKEQIRSVLRHFFLKCPIERFRSFLAFEISSDRKNIHNFSWIKEDTEVLLKFYEIHHQFKLSSPDIISKNEEELSLCQQILESQSSAFKQLESAGICSQEQLTYLWSFNIPVSTSVFRKPYLEAVDTLKKRYSQGAISVSILEGFCQKKNPVLVRQAAALILVIILSDNSQAISTAIKTLIDIIRTEDDLLINHVAANIINQIPPNPKLNPIFVQILKDCMDNPIPSTDQFRYLAFCSLVSYLSHKLPYPDAHPILYS